MARTSVYVPDDLKARMDAVDDDVNWSALAVVAFEAKLAEIAERRENKTMDDVVQRYRASRLKAGSEDFAQGSEAGVSWARESAEWSEMDRLGRVGDPDRWLCEEAPGASFLFVIDPAMFDGQDPRRWFRRFPTALRDQIGMFWLEQAGSEEGPSTDFVRGFVAGAHGVFSEVRKRLA